MSYFVFPDTGRNEKNELTVHTRTVHPKVGTALNWAGLREHRGTTIISAHGAIIIIIYWKKQITNVHT